MIRVAVPIPVRGRHPMLIHTIRRLYRQQYCEVHVVCTGDKADREVCEREGAHFIEVPNTPLGSKWQLGMYAAREYDPDCVLYVGSSDWLCENWVHKLFSEMLLSGAGMAGKTDINFLDLSETSICRGVWWPGYAKEGGRANEAIGTGRLLSRGCLNAMRWQVFNPVLDNSLDYSMLEHVLRAKCSTYLSCDPELQAASLSCWQWVNKHKFVQTYRMPHCNPLQPEALKALVERHFSDLRLIFGKELTYGVL